MTGIKNAVCIISFLLLLLVVVVLALPADATIAANVTAGTVAPSISIAPTTAATTGTTAAQTSPTANTTTEVPPTTNALISGIVTTVNSPVVTPTATPTLSPVVTPTVTPIPIRTVCITPTPLPTGTVSVTPTPTGTALATRTVPTVCPVSATPTTTPTSIVTATPIISTTGTVSVTPTISVAATSSVVTSPVITATTTLPATTASVTPTITTIVAATLTPTPVVTVSVTPVAQTLNKIEPNSGSTSGGVKVDIMGSGFSKASDVLFGENKAVSYQIVSDTLIRAVTPAHSAGTVKVSVVTPQGNIVLDNAFTFTGSLSVQIITPKIIYSGKITGNWLTLTSYFDVLVTDTTGSNTGWHVNASITGLDASSKLNSQIKHSIEGVELIDFGGVAPISKTLYSVALSQIETSIYSATPGSGIGQTTLRFKTQLRLPADVKVGNYNFTLNVTIASGLDKGN